MISIDGHEWPVPCDVERLADVRSSDISGELLDGRYLNDVVGTYLSYSVSLAVPTTMQADYDELYEVLTDPVADHVFVMPYGRGTVEIVARVEQVKDTYVYVASGRSYWRGITFTVTANHPTRRRTATEAYRHGVSPLPNSVNVPVGTTYTATEDGWTTETIPDADARRY